MRWFLLLVLIALVGFWFDSSNEYSARLHVAVAQLINGPPPADTTPALQIRTTPLPADPGVNEVAPASSMSTTINNSTNDIFDDPANKKEKNSTHHSESDLLDGSGH
jgi:hypothetical protein